MIARIILLTLISLTTYGQNTIGLPDVINYTKSTYNAGLQNWDIKQDRNGIIYIANNEGLLSFDGTYWKLYPLPNKTIVRSVEIGIDNKIYVGGQDELGYFAPDANGRLKYFSLTDLIPAKDKSFGDVWDIVSFNKETYFRSLNKIFKFNNQSVATYDAISEWGYLTVCNNILYAQDFRTGLMTYSNNVWQPIQSSLLLPTNDPITSILSINDNTSIITTLKSGLFQIQKGVISKISSSNNELFQSDRIYSATIIDSNWIALATSNKGVFIVDHKGAIIQSFSETEGIQNNNILSIFKDNQGNLWLGQNNGIDCIAYNSSIKHINAPLQNGSGYTAIIHNNQLYIGTSNGLYFVALQQKNDLSFSKGKFDIVKNSEGQVWNLSVINNQLLLGHHEGAFRIEGNVASNISSTPGFWNFLPTTNTFPSPQIIAGHYKGLQFFDYKDGIFTPDKKVPGFTESSRFVTIDNNDNIWVSHPYHGIYKITKQPNGNFATTFYNEKNGLPSTLNNHIYKIKNEIVAATEKGIYIYNNNKNVFEESEFYKELLGVQSIRYLKEDQTGNIWFIHNKSLGVIDYSGKKPAIFFLPELTGEMLSGFEYIYSVNDKNLFVGGEKGFFHINYEKYKETIPTMQLQIRSVKIINNSDSILFGGYFEGKNENQLQDKNSIPALNSDWKTIRFEYSSPLFSYQTNLEYSYRLKGFDNNWSAWTKRTEKEYTNLSTGYYTFEVKVRNNLGTESTISSYSFRMSPPWYLSFWAWLFYFLLFIAFNYGLYKWLKEKFKKQQHKHEQEQKKLKYIFELEKNKTESEIVALRNEKLEAEINLQNSEMASSAMHLAKKGELLKKIKVEFTQVMKRVDNEEAITELKKIIRKLSDDDKIDNEWDNFAIHFDKTHSDFVTKVKEKHPDITANELKLCVYLRMNLSTKEIAQFLNISVRGVEISRYRLRKKLALPSEVSLFDYLIGFNNKQAF